MPQPSFQDADIAWLAGALRYSRSWARAPQRRVGRALVGDNATEIDEREVQGLKGVTGKATARCLALDPRARTTPSLAIACPRVWAHGARLDHGRGDTGFDSRTPDHTKAV